MKLCTLKNEFFLIAKLLILLTLLLWHKNIKIIMKILIVFAENVKTERT